MVCKHTACRDCLECKSTGRRLFECPIDGDVIDKTEAIITFDEIKRSQNPMDPMNKNNNPNPPFSLDNELYRKVKTRERLEVQRLNKASDDREDKFQLHVKRETAARVDKKPMLFAQIPDPTKINRLTAEEEERINGVRKVPVGSDFML